MNYQELLKNEIFRGVIILLIGITIGVVFYPSKKIEEQVSAKYEQQITKLKEQHDSELSMMRISYDQLVTSSLQSKQEQERKITELNVQIKDLKSKQKTAYYKIVKPDGTVEIKKFTESEVTESTKVISQIQEEFKVKVEQIENKWSEVHKQRVIEIQKQFDSKESEYRKTIAELQASKTVTTNEKRFGLEAGILTNKDYYGHASMDVWGPMFLGIQGEFGQDNKMGIGVGVRF